MKNVLYFIILLNSILLTNSDKLINVAEKLKRDKRWLLFSINGGTSKMVLGFLVPIDVGKRRSLGWAINFQAQYAIPPTIIYPVNKFQKRSLMRQKLSILTQQENAKNVSNSVEDKTRECLYRTIEAVWSRKGKNGRDCLLRAICEIADSPLKHNGMFGEIIDNIFTPGNEKLDAIYYEARNAGKMGADCMEIYSDCPMGEGILDRITLSDY